MWREFRLGDVVIMLFHSHGQKDMSKGRIDGSQWNLFNKSVKPMKVKDR